MAITEHDQAEMAKAMIKAVFEDGEAEINGRKYCFLKMTHKERRKVFAFYTKVQEQVARKDMSFLDSPEFEPVEAVINKSVSINDSLLLRVGDTHWEKYPEDYVSFIMTALPVISFPFFPAAPIS